MAKLRALVLGSGFAGKGHAEAFMVCGVEIAGMAARTESVVGRGAADIQGRSHRPYFTFRDGWLAQEVIDTARAGQGWRVMPGDV